MIEKKEKLEIESILEIIVTERERMFNYYKDMDKAYKQNQSDKASALGSMVYAAKSIIDDCNERISLLKITLFG